MRKAIPYIIGGILGYFGIKALKGMDYMKVDDNDDYDDYDDDLPENDENGNGNGNGGNGNGDITPINVDLIPIDYREPEILIDNGVIYSGVIPIQFRPIIDVEHYNVGGINLNDVTQVADLGYDRYEIINPIELTTLQSFNIGAGANQFTVEVRHINSLTYEFTLIQNYTGFYVNGISWIINGEELSSMNNEPIMYQFPNAGYYDIDVEIYGGQQDFDDYSSDPGLENEFIYFTLTVDDPSGSDYSSGTTEVAFNDMIAMQSGL